MSMTAEQRKEWAYANLDRYLRDVEIGEFMGAMGDVGHLEDRVCDLENVTEELGRQVDDTREELSAVQDELDKIAEQAS